MFSSLRRKHNMGIVVLCWMFLYNLLYFIPFINVTLKINFYYYGKSYRNNKNMTHSFARKDFNSTHYLPKDPIYLSQSKV